MAQNRLDHTAEAVQSQEIAQRATVAAKALMADLGLHRREATVLKDSVSYNEAHGRQLASLRDANKKGTQAHKFAANNQVSFDAWNNMMEEDGADAEYDGQAHRLRIREELTNKKNMLRVRDVHPSTTAVSSSGRGGGNAGRPVSYDTSSTQLKKQTKSNSLAQLGAHNSRRSDRVPSTRITESERKSLTKNMKHLKEMGVAVSPEDIADLVRKVRGAKPISSIKHQKTPQRGVKLGSSKANVPAKVTHPLGDRHDVKPEQPRSLSHPRGEVYVGDQFLQDASRHLTHVQSKSASTENADEISRFPTSAKTCTVNNDSDKTTTQPHPPCPPTPAGNETSVQQTISMLDAQIELLRFRTPSPCSDALAAGQQIQTSPVTTNSYLEDLKGLEFSIPTPTSPIVEPESEYRLITLGEIDQLTSTAAIEMLHRFRAGKRGLEGLIFYAPLNYSIRGMISNVQSNILQIEDHLRRQNIELPAELVGDSLDRLTPNQEPSIQKPSKSSCLDYHIDQPLDETKEPISTRTGVKKPTWSLLGQRQGIYDSIYSTTAPRLTENLAATQNLSAAKPNNGLESQDLSSKPEVMKDLQRVYPSRSNEVANSDTASRKTTRYTISQLQSMRPGPNEFQLHPELRTSISGILGESQPSQSAIQSLRESFENLSIDHAPKQSKPITKQSRSASTSCTRSSTLERRQHATYLAICPCRSLQELRELSGFDDSDVVRTIQQTQQTLVIQFTSHEIAEKTMSTLLKRSSMRLKSYEARLVHDRNVDNGQELFNSGTPYTSEYGRNNASLDMKDPPESTAWLVTNVANFREAYDLVPKSYLQRVSRVMKVNPTTVAIHFYSHDDAKNALLQTPLHFRAAGKAVPGGLLKIDWLLPGQEKAIEREYEDPPSPPPIQSEPAPAKDISRWSPSTASHGSSQRTLEKAAMEAPDELLPSVLPTLVTANLSPSLANERPETLPKSTHKALSKSHESTPSTIKSERGQHLNLTSAETFLSSSTSKLKYKGADFVMPPAARHTTNPPNGNGQTELTSLYQAVDMLHEKSATACNIPSTAPEMPARLSHRQLLGRSIWDADNSDARTCGEDARFLPCIKNGRRQINTQENVSPLSTPSHTKLNDRIPFPKYTRVKHQLPAWLVEEQSKRNLDKKEGNRGKVDRG